MSFDSKDNGEHVDVAGGDAHSGGRRVDNDGLLRLARCHNQPRPRAGRRDPPRRGAGAADGRAGGVGVAAGPVKFETDVLVMGGSEGARLRLEQAAVVMEVLEWVARNRSGPGSTPTAA